MTDIMRLCGLLLLVVAGWTFPYYKMPHSWKALFTTNW